MRSTNYALRKAIVTALTGITYQSVAVPVYYLEAPDTNTANNYIIIDSVGNFDESTKATSETDSNVQISIHTGGEKSNSGLAADTIASSVLQAIYPNKQTRINLSADNMQCTNTRLVSDNTQPYSILGSKRFVTRTIVFSFKVFMY